MTWAGRRILSRWDLVDILSGISPFTLYWHKIWGRIDFWKIILKAYSGLPGHVLCHVICEKKKSKTRSLLGGTYCEFKRLVFSRRERERERRQDYNPV